MGKSYREQASYDYMHGKDIDNSEYIKLKKKWNKRNFGLDKSEKLKRKYKNYD
jgi:hypothetical protein